jgi:hypothetical protein
MPVLTHFHIYGGRVQGGNGRIAIDAPCPELAGFDCTVPAERFLKAVDACDGEPKLKLTDAGKLTVSKGKFRATLPLAEHAAFPKVAEVPHTSSFLDGVKWPALLPLLRKLYPFIGEDASRPWSCGVLLDGGYAWATNNVSLARVPCALGQNFVLPIFAVDELLRIGQEPASVQADKNSIWFYFAEGWWMRCQKLEGAWPDVAAFMPAEPSDSYAPAKALAEAVRKVLPFCPDPKHPVIQTGPEGVSTLDGEMSASVGHDGLTAARFRAEPLLAVLEAAAGIDLSTYPKACYWRGDGIDGVIVGMRA